MTINGWKLEVLGNDKNDTSKATQHNNFLKNCDEQMFRYQHSLSVTCVYANVTEASRHLSQFPSKNSAAESRTALRKKLAGPSWASERELKREVCWSTYTSAKREVEDAV